jgi:glutamine amidotransferase
MGWNTVESATGSTLFHGVEGESFYFVHSYAARDITSGLATYATQGQKFLAAVEDGSLSATQFHPEKSGRAGLALIKNWSKSL